MLSKHPQFAPPPVPNSPTPSPISVSESDIVRALHSFPCGTAPGPSCLRATHLKEAVFCSSPVLSTRALKGLHGIVNLLCAGQVPNYVVPHLCGATLLACQKKNGGFRPIAIGEVLRRLTSNCVVRAVQAVAVSILSPLESLSAVHSLHSVLQDACIPPESRCTLLVGFSNVFNCIDRAFMFQEARARIPSMSPWLECCYASRPQLLFGEHTILSCSGVQQGDPLGPLGFALTLHPILERIKQEVPNLLLNSWYLDDGTLCGSIADLCAALAIIEEDGPARGLFLNRSKSLLYVPAEASCNSSTFPPRIPCTSEGFVLLGAPFGPPSFCSSAILERFRRFRCLCPL